MSKDVEFELLRPIHFPDGTEAKELPRYPDMDRLFVEHMRKCIDRELEKKKAPCGTAIPQGTKANTTP